MYGVRLQELELVEAATAPLVPTIEEILDMRAAFFAGLQYDYMRMTDQIPDSEKEPRDAFSRIAESGQGTTMAAIPGNYVLANSAGRPYQERCGGFAVVDASAARNLGNINGRRINRVWKDSFRSGRKPTDACPLRVTLIVPEGKICTATAAMISEFDRKHPAPRRTLVVEAARHGNGWRPGESRQHPSHTRRGNSDRSFRG